MELRFWGVRGSTPVTGARTIGYGGNTSCVEVRMDGGARVIFDGGTGIRPLGAEFGDEDSHQPIEIFLTHFHLDHIQGLPFFLPLRDRRRRVRITAPVQGEQDLTALLGHNLSPVYFPVPLLKLGSGVELRTSTEGEQHCAGDCAVDSIRVDHPSTTLAYRVRGDHATIVYAPDNELLGPTPLARERFARFCAGADLLVHDAMYTDEQWSWRRGWGHSTFRQAVDFAIEVGVSQLAFFHHDPDRTDVELDEIVAAERERLRGMGCPLRVVAAREGEVIAVRRG